MASDTQSFPFSIAYCSGGPATAEDERLMSLVVSGKAEISGAWAIMKQVSAVVAERPNFTPPVKAEANTHG